MISGSHPRATPHDLYREEGKAELIGGKIVRYGARGCFPSQVAGEISFSLWHHTKATHRGRAYGGGLGYVVPELPSGRESFQPDASYYDGPHPVNPMAFIERAPTFAVEVRGADDYGPAGDADRAARRSDYFAAGTLVVWDVDCLALTVAVYRPNAPGQPTIYRRGDTAEAEPAVPGRRMAVADIFNG